MFFIAFLEFSADFIFFIFYFTGNFGKFSKSFLKIKKEETFSDPVVENCHYVVKKKALVHGKCAGHGPPVATSSKSNG